MYHQFMGYDIQQTLNLLNSGVHCHSGPRPRKVTRLSCFHRPLTPSHRALPSLALLPEPQGRPPLCRLNSLPLTFPGETRVPALGRRKGPVPLHSQFHGSHTKCVWGPGGLGHHGWNMPRQVVRPLRTASRRPHWIVSCL